MLSLSNLLLACALTCAALTAYAWPHVDATWATGSVAAVASSGALWWSLRH